MATDGPRVIPGTRENHRAGNGGQGRNRTSNTRIFSSSESRFGARKLKTQNEFSRHRPNRPADRAYSEHRSRGPAEPRTKFKKRKGTGASRPNQFRIPHYAAFLLRAASARSKVACRVIHSRGEVPSASARSSAASAVTPRFPLMSSLSRAFVPARVPARTRSASCPPAAGTPRAASHRGESDSPAERTLRGHPHTLHTLSGNSTTATSNALPCSTGTQHATDH